MRHVGRVFARRIVFEVDARQVTLLRRQVQELVLQVLRIVLVQDAIEAIAARLFDR